MIKQESKPMNLAPLTSRFRFGLYSILSLTVFLSLVPLSYAQETAEWRFGDGTAEEMTGNAFRRPGTPQLIDNNGGTTTGAGHGPNFRYEYDAIPSYPNNVYGNWWSPTYNTFTVTANGVNGTGTDTYAKNLGVSYQSNGDIGNAASTSTYFKYRAQVLVFTGTWRRSFGNTTANPTCEIDLTFTPSRGNGPHPFHGMATPGDNSITIGNGVVSVPVNWIMSDGFKMPTTYDMSIPVGQTPTGVHTAKQSFVDQITVTTRGQIKISGQGQWAKAWGDLRWDLFMETGSLQTRYIFPSRDTQTNLIRFSR
jgi:hypothetical protein